MVGTADSVLIREVSLIQPCIPLSISAHPDLAGMCFEVAGTLLGSLIQGIAIALSGHSSNTACIQGGTRTYDDALEGAYRYGALTVAVVAILAGLVPFFGVKEQRGRLWWVGMAHCGRFIEVMALWGKIVCMLLYKKVCVCGLLYTKECVCYCTVKSVWGGYYTLKSVCVIIH